MIWRSRIRPWVAAAIVIVLAGGLFWIAVRTPRSRAALPPRRDWVRP